MSKSSHRRAAGPSRSRQAAEAPLDLLTLLVVVLRRWPVVLPVLALTALVAVYLANTTPAEYQARASLLLTPYEQSLMADEDGGSAMSAQELDTSSIIELLQSPATRSRLRSQGATGDYAIAVIGDGSILRVTATGEAEDKAVRTVEAVFEEIERVVRTGQEGVSGALPVRVERLASPGLVSQAQADEEGGKSSAVASGSMLLVRPDAGENPYRASGYSSRVLQEVIGGPTGRRRVREAGGTGTFLIEQLNRDTAPILYVEATDAEAESTDRTLDAVLDVLTDELAVRQSALGIPPTVQMVLEPLAMPGRATLVSNNLKRPILTVAGLGIVAAVSIALLVEAFVASAPRRRAPRSPTGASSAPRRGRFTKKENAASRPSEPAQGKTLVAGPSRARNQPAQPRT